MQHKDNITLIAFSFLLFSEFQLQMTVIHFTPNQLLLTVCTPVTSHEQFKLLNVSEYILQNNKLPQLFGGGRNTIWCYFQLLSAKWKKGTKCAIILMRYSKKTQQALDKSSNTYAHGTTAQGELCSSLCCTCHTTENLKHWILHSISMALFWRNWRTKYFFLPHQCPPQGLPCLVPGSQ